MENKQLARPFRQLAQLLELYDENIFKVRAVASAGLKIDKSPVLLWELPARELETIEGIGKSITAKIVEIRLTGVLAELEEYKEKTPIGILEMLRIKGLGPKKTRIIWKEMGLDTLADLYYACNENRLVEIKGFGTKTQEEIKKVLEFTFRSQGKFLYPLAEPVAADWIAQLSPLAGVTEVVVTGQLRRRNEIVDLVELLVNCPAAAGIDTYLHALPELNWGADGADRPTGDDRTTGADGTAGADGAADGAAAATLRGAGFWSFKDAAGMPIHIYQATPTDFAKALFLTTGSPAHLLAFGELLAETSSEEAIYAAKDMQYIEPELREGLNEINLALTHSIKPLIVFSDLKGSIHNHSTYSDGVHTLKEMAQAAIALGLEYLVMSDHSQAAFYAHGLLPAQVVAQHAEIDDLNKKLAPFHIFKSIESDILSDGSLDYPADILSSFDLVIASVHSNLRMNEEKATTRLLKAIENPYTTILGHATGRLLLGREGYPIDHRKVIDACAANDVVIEINANPNRLDLDWRWVPYALEQGVHLSINPDAHRKEGLLDMHYGIAAARKGGLYKERCLNALSLPEITSWIAARKISKGIA